MPEPASATTSERLLDAAAKLFCALRATEPIAGRTGFIVPAFDLQNFAQIASRATVAEIAANHYDIIMHDHTLSVIRRFLDAA